MFSVNLPRKTWTGCKFTKVRILIIINIEKYKFTS